MHLLNIHTSIAHLYITLYSRYAVNGRVGLIGADTDASATLSGVFAWELVMIDWLSLDMMNDDDGWWTAFSFGMHKSILGFLCEYVTQSKQPRPFFFYGTSVTRTMLTQFKFQHDRIWWVEPFLKYERQSEISVADEQHTGWTGRQFCPMLTLCHQFHGEKSSPLESDAHEQVGLHDAHEQAFVLWGEGRGGARRWNKEEMRPTYYL